MTTKFSKSLKRTVAFTSALALVTSATVLTNADAKRKVQYESKVSDYTSLMPGLSGAKLRLSDPTFSEKSWYEYIEYEYYTKVEDGDVIFKIYKPKDYSLASVMAITDHVPDETNELGQNLSMSIQEDLQAIFDIAAKGHNISEGFADLEFTKGISKSMNNIGDIMDNSKYYASTSNLGIPSDKKYNGIDNTGFYTASSISIAITDTNSITAGKVVSANSNYNTSYSTLMRKDYSDYTEAAKATGMTTENSQTVGSAISDTVGIELTDSMSLEDTISSERTIEEAYSSTEYSESTHTTEVSAGVGVHEESGSNWNLSGKLGVDFSGKIFGKKMKISPEIGGGGGHEWSDGSSAELSASVSDSTTKGKSKTYSNSFSVTGGESHSLSVGQSLASSQEHSISRNVENSKTKGSSIEESLTKGASESSGREQENAVAIDVGYGVEYQAGNGYEHSTTVTRTFDARDDELVKGVGWKLCDYIVKVPFYIEAVEKPATNNPDEEPVVLYGQYVEYNLLQGVCRVFANGYIEHWYTGELVNYAGFFDGFITASELIDKAKSKQAQRVPKGE